MKALKPYAKAIVPLVTGFIASILTAISAGTIGRATVFAALAALVTSATVYMVPNQPAT